MEINYNKCRKVVEKLNSYFDNNDEIANVNYPLNIEFKTNEYYLYMFYSCLLDYGMRSKIYHKNLIDTYMKHKNIFEPSYVIEMSEEDLKNIIVNYIHPRYPNIATKKWITLSRELFKYDNVLKKLENINSFEELNKFIKNTKSYGQKTGGLLIRIICDSGICNFRESVKAIPIDRHDIEISYITGIIDSMNIDSRQITNLSDTYVNVGQELKINPSNIDKYLWEIGNSFCNRKNCQNCPLNDVCIKASNKSSLKVR